MSDLFNLARVVPELLTDFELENKIRQIMEQTLSKIVKRLNATSSKVTLIETKLDGNKEIAYEFSRIKA